jgi:hypothetical protein
MSEADAGRVRLDSWKAIAAYLQRDIATARRWEKQGLPVRRIAGGRGRSVFAYADEIDAWLGTAPEAQAQAPAPATPVPLPMWSRVAIAIALVAIVSVAAWQVLTARVSPGDLRVAVGRDAVVAFDAAGKERWRHVFPASWLTFPLDGRAVVVTGERPAVYAATAHKVRASDELGGSGELLQFDLEGTQQRSFSFEDQVMFAGKPFGPPWALTGFAVDEREGRRRIAVAAHHYIWSPSLVTILDETWQRRGTFTHDGWIESVYWTGPDRLLIGGFSQERNGGMIAMLDAASLDDQRPIEMIAMPRSEVNKVAAAPFNRAIVQMLPDRILVRTVEVATPDQAAEAIYEFSPGLELTMASFSSNYWDTHRALELQGKLNHSRERCPYRDGPRSIEVWEPSTGWTTTAVGSR